MLRWNGKNSRKIRVIVKNIWASWKVQVEKKLGFFRVQMIFQSWLYKVLNGKLSVFEADKISKHHSRSLIYDAIDQAEVSKIFKYKNEKSFVKRKSCLGRNKKNK